MGADLSKFPTKTDLNELTSKFATKADLEDLTSKFATKADLENITSSVNMNIAAIRADIAGIKKAMATSAEVQALEVRVRTIERVSAVRKLKQQVLIELKKYFVTNKQNFSSAPPPPQVLPRILLRSSPTMANNILLAMDNNAREKFNVDENEYQQFIVDYDSRRLNCDVMGRFCFASIVGLDTKFVDNTTDADDKNKHRRCVSIRQAQGRIAMFTSDQSSDGVMLLRFTKQGSTTDGHTLMLLKFESTIRTFQAYYLVSEFKEFACDMTKAFLEELIKRPDDEVCASSFGFTEEGATMNKWKVDCDRVYVYSNVV